MAEFAYLTPDRVLTISRTGQKRRLHEYTLSAVSFDNLRRLHAVLSSDTYQKSVELDDRDLTPTVYFFRVKPFVIPPEFVTDHPVILHDFVPALPVSVEEN